MTQTENGARNNHKPTGVTRSQFLVIILITVALAVVLDFGHRVTVNAELQKEARQLEREVATLEAEHRALEKQREQVQTDAYVAEWARSEGVMALEGEMAIAPVPVERSLPDAPAPTPSMESEEVSKEAETPSSHWTEWWDFFFGSETQVSPPEGE